MGLTASRRANSGSCALFFQGFRGFVRASYELHDPSAKYPIPKRVICTEDGASLKGRVVSTNICEYDLKEASKPARDEEFTLAAFGLPEPVGVPRVGSRGTPWHLLFGAGAFIALVLAVGCKRLAKHYKQNEKPATTAKT